MRLTLLPRDLKNVMAVHLVPSAAFARAMVKLHDAVDDCGLVLEGCCTTECARCDHETADSLRHHAKGSSGLGVRALRRERTGRARLQWSRTVRMGQTGCAPVAQGAGLSVVSPDAPDAVRRRRAGGPGHAQIPAAWPIRTFDALLKEAETLFMPPPGNYAQFSHLERLTRLWAISVE